MDKEKIRERLVELVKRAIIDWEHGDVSERIADHLLANGVTIAEDKWISVSERLPDEELEDFVERLGWEVYPCLATVKREIGDRYVTKLFYDGGDFVNDDLVRFTSQVTHWMPLPRAPKEET